MCPYARTLKLTLYVLDDYKSVRPQFETWFPRRTVFLIMIKSQWLIKPRLQVKISFYFSMYSILRQSGHPVKQRRLQER